MVNYIFEMHLNLIEPLQHRQTLLAKRGMSVWRSADFDPEPKSAFLSSTVQSGVLAHLQQLDVQEAAWLVACAPRAKVLGITGH